MASIKSLREFMKRVDSDSKKINDGVLFFTDDGFPVKIDQYIWKIYNGAVLPRLVKNESDGIGATFYRKENADKFNSEHQQQEKEKRKIKCEIKKL